MAAWSTQVAQSALGHSTISKFWSRSKVLAPGPMGVGFNEQIFGADKQVPKGGCWPCPKNTSGPGNSVRASKKCSARPVTQSGRAEYRDVRPALLTCPGRQWLGPFPSMSPSWDQMKPRTVYEKAVQDFTETARQLARLNRQFRQASFG